MITLDAIRILVLDEADRMLDMGFRPQVDRIVRRLSRERQTMFFSATLDGEVGQMAGEYTRGAQRHEAIPQTDQVSGQVEHLFVPVTAETKVEKLVELLSEERGKALVFVRTKRGADRLVRKLERHDVAAVAMHGDKTQGAREKALKRFDAGKVSTLVATDVAARGLDLDRITHVINFDPPVRGEGLRPPGRPHGSRRPNGTGITLVLPEQQADVSRVAARVGEVGQFETQGMKVAAPRVVYTLSPRPQRPLGPARAAAEDLTGRHLAMIGRVKIAVVGAGAMGSVYAGLLAAAGHDVTAIDTWAGPCRRDQRARPARRRGERRPYRECARLRATPPTSAPVDLVILATKAHDVQHAARAAIPLVGDDTVVLPIQNGLGSADRVASILGEERVAIGVVGGFGASVVAPGHVRHEGWELVRLGEREPPAERRIETIADVWREAGFRVQTYDDIDRLVWEKLVCNVCFSGVCAVLERTVGEVMSRPGRLEGGLPLRGRGLRGRLRDGHPARIRRPSRVRPRPSARRSRTPVPRCCSTCWPVGRARWTCLNGAIPPLGRHGRPECSVQRGCHRARQGEAGCSPARLTNQPNVLPLAERGADLTLEIAKHRSGSAAPACGRSTGPRRAAGRSARRQTGRAPCANGTTSTSNPAAASRSPRSRAVGADAVAETIAPLPLLRRHDQTDLRSSAPASSGT